MTLPAVMAELRRRRAWIARLPFEAHELMAQRQNFQGEIVPRSKERKRIPQNDPKKGQHGPVGGEFIV